MTKLEELEKEYGKATLRFKLANTHMQQIEQALIEEMKREQGKEEVKEVK